MIKKIFNFSTNKTGKWAVIALWIFFVFLATLGPSLVDATENNASSFLPTDSDSLKALKVSQAAFPSDGIPLMIVFANKNTLTEVDYDSGKKINDWLNSPDAPKSIRNITSVYNVPNARSELISPDGTVMNIIVNVIGEPNSDEFTSLVKDVRNYAHQFRTDSLQINVGGPGGLIVDLVAVFATIDVQLLVASAMLVLILLVIIYRSPIIPFVPLLAVGIVYFIAGTLGAVFANEFGFSINGQSSGIMTIILFGSGTDYCLFISSRYREELLRHENKHDAMQITMQSVGPAVLSSSGTIIIASLILLIASLGSTVSLGPLLAIALFVMMAASLTLVPAILLALGRISFWPMIPKYGTYEDNDKKIYGKIASWVLTRPKKIIVTNLSILLICSLGIFLYSPNYDALDSLPSETESVKSFRMLRQGFPDGKISPSYAYLTLNEKFNENVFNKIEQITDDIASHPNVADAASIAMPFGINGPVSSQIIQKIIFDPQDKPEEELIKNSAFRFASSNLKVFRFDITFVENPFSSSSLDSILELREISMQSLQNLGLMNSSISFGGDTAEQADSRTAINRDNLIILPLILIAIAIILAILLKSLVAPIYLCATILVTYGATLGLSLLVFKYIFGHTGIAPGTLFYLFVFLNALGVDYNIYVMSRIREEAKSKNLELAIKDAISATGGVITSAGLILAGTFAVLMTLPLIDLFQLGFAVALGVIMDTFLTRTIIVPAIVKLLGDKNWWPSKLRPIDN
ncbi:MAG: putative drug exporter of the RND superfamily [Chloroflexi bacterium]|jgi:RND superfamily putative drug exporter|nr:MAG: putative drug exporter of the RND superfamily [Chloroflexota bacterium]|tara:strand:- start:14930 stop:17179 length:2250 start_codon:yes stop_codon:yes gene_type:complete